MKRAKVSFSIEYENLFVEVSCNNYAALILADNLLGDLPAARNNHGRKAVKLYEIIFNEDGDNFLLWENKKQIYKGQSQYALSYILINKILYDCISGNISQHAIHAGGVRRGDYGVILPGLSGRGKSTLTAWLCLNGFGYLTDELLFISDDGKITPFTRPVNLKTREPIVSIQFFEKYKKQILISDNGASMIPHRILNKNFLAEKVRATHIIFPQYRDGAQTEFIELSPAKSCLKLLQSHVNARNLPSHGITSLSNIVRKCTSYELIYSTFNELTSLLQTKIPFPSSDEKIPHT